MFPSILEYEPKQPAANVASIRIRAHIMVPPYTPCSPSTQGRTVKLFVDFFKEGNARRNESLKD